MWCNKMNDGSKMKYFFLSSPKLFSDSKAKIIKNYKKVSGNISVLKTLSIQRYHKFNSIKS